MKTCFPSSIDRKALLADGMMMLTDGTRIPFHLGQQKADKEVVEKLAVRAPKNRLPDKLLEREDNFAFFIDNVFFFVARYEAIRSDSRMFLAPVTSFDKMLFSTLGVFIEWWIFNPEMIDIDQDGKLHICITPWQGAPFEDHISVDEDGNTNLLFGHDSHCSFYSIDKRYEHCKSVGEAYTLTEVKDLLGQNAAHPSDYIASAYRHALTWKSVALTYELQQTQHELYDAQRRNQFYANASRLTAIIEGYRKMDAKNTSLLEDVRAAMRYLKARLKAGAIDSKDYAKQLKILKEKKDCLCNDTWQSDAKLDAETMLSLVFPDKRYTLEDLLQWDKERKLNHAKPQ